MHTAGEPVRIVTGGYPELSGASILEKRREAMRLHDDIRRILVLEPRWHSGMYGVIPVRPTDPRAALAELLIQGEGYSIMCGHATLSLGTWLVERGQAPAIAPATRGSSDLQSGLIEDICSGAKW